MLVNGERETRTFKSKDDVWQVIDLIIEETKLANEKGGDFGISESVISQLPFFACQNILMDNKIQKDIERYVYCEKFGVPPYRGSYGDQPAKWVDRSFSIRTAIAKKEKKEINAKKQRISRNNTN